MKELTITNIYEMDFFKKIIYGRQSYSPKVITLLNSYGRQPIKKISVCRSPLHTITFLSKLVASTPHDKLYHLFLKITLENGVELVLEKNEVINLDFFRGYKNGTELRDVPVHPNLTIDILLNKTKEAMGNKFFPYQAGSNNCQVFIYNILKSNNLLTTENQSFILQKTQDIFKNETLRKFTNTLTDIAGRLDVIKQGGTENDLSPNNGMTDRQIKSILGNNLNGIYMKDEIPKRLKDGWYIINMDDSNDPRNGTHWVAFKLENKIMYYFDPIGIIPPIEVLKLGWTCYYNNQQIQDRHSTACGWFCISFILFDKKYKDRNKYFSLFSKNTKENDFILKQLLEKLIK